MKTENPAAQVKLSCRNLWKVFGPNSSAMLRGYTDQVDSRDVLKSNLRASGHFPAVIGVSFDVHPGEIFVIMGLSGSGKSTLVRCLSRLIEPTHGHLLLDGEDLLTVSKKRLIELRRRSIGMVFQSFGLLPHLTVRENVAFPLKIQGIHEAKASKRAEEMIALVGLSGKQNSLPHELSGGQQQRVGIARSLAVGPELWFLDEPFSALDPLIRRQMQDEFLRLQAMLKKTIVFITHDIGEAFRLADRIAIMRDGEVIQLGSPAEIALKPVDGYVAEFTEEISLARVITANDLVNRGMHGNLAVTSGPFISSDATLDELIPQVAAGTPGFTVQGKDGQFCGHIASQDIIAVLEQDRLRRRVT